MTCAIVFLSGAAAEAYQYSGRVTLGSFLAHEQLAEISGGQSSNDVNTLSGRFFLKVSDITSSRFEVVSDVRDRNDFFGLLDKERLSLGNRNTLQVRELSAKYPGPTLFTEAGRFPIPEAGAVYTDGLLQGVHLSKSVRVAAFGGLNPKRPEQTYVQWNPDSQVYGAYLSYVPGYDDQGTSVWLDTAFVDDIVKGDTDRTYLHVGSLWQWSPKSRLSLRADLDFVPRMYLQNGLATYTQTVGTRWSFALSAWLIDVIEYQRRQSVREQLPSSPYREERARLRYTLGDDVQLEASYATGHRNADGLDRRETVLSADFLRVAGPSLGVTVALGYRDNFVSYDTFVQARASYTSRLWEISLDEQYAYEKYKGARLLYHPLVSEISVARAIGSSLFGALSFQDVRDERVKITSFFARVTYRFGSRGLPPLRDLPPLGGPL